MCQFFQCQHYNKHGQTDNTISIPKQYKITALKAVLNIDTDFVLIGIKFASNYLVDQIILS